MNITLIISISVILIIIIAIASGVLVKAASSLSVDKNDYNDKQAKKYIDTAASIGWVTIGLIVISAIAAYIVGLTPAGIKGLEIYMNVFFGFLIVVFIIIGFLSMLGAIYIKKGDSKNGNKDEYSTCVWVAVTFFGGIVIVSLYYIINSVIKKKEEKQKAMELEKEILLKKIALATAQKSR